MQAGIPRCFEYVGCLHGPICEVIAAYTRGEQLKRLPEILEQRRFLAERYRSLLAGIPGLALPREPAWGHTNWQSCCVRLPDGCDQRQVMHAMLDQEVSTRRGV